MKSIYETSQYHKYVFIIVAILIVIASVFVSDRLIKDLAAQERHNIEIWGDATRAIASDNPDLNLSLILRVINGNSSIPVILCNEKDEPISYKNIQKPDKDGDAFMAHKIKELKAKNKPIVIDMGDGTFQYVYYDESNLLKRLLIFPYAQLAVVFFFILIAFVALLSTKKAEQNKVWVGLSKETAHQLGTPISSLIAWIEYLRSQPIDPDMLKEMEKDVKRLETIAERFSKIGSNPDPIPVDIGQSIQTALDYMKTRISSKVVISTVIPPQPVMVLMNESLFAWVVENLTKNAVDAMDGHGKINFLVDNRGKTVRIDVSDTGKGIPKSKFKTVFNPGYTTKKRGWGLGLSLVKRIIESYQGGKIFVRSSELGKGTTFRIELRTFKS